MRIAAFYDIHGNLPALEAVLGDVARAGVDRIVVGGDVVPGPMPTETFAALLDLHPSPLFLYGNGERDVLAAHAGGPLEGVPEQARELIRWTAGALPLDRLSVLASWPPTVRLEIPGLGPVLFCHATPRNEREIFTVRTPESALLDVFDAAEAAVVVCGHTHMQFDRRVGATRVVNAGSVGMPFGDPGAYWLLLGPDVELRHTPYDLEAAARRIRGSDYPQADGFAENNVQHPPSEGAMLAALEKAALRSFPAR